MQQSSAARKQRPTSTKARAPAAQDVAAADRSDPKKGKNAVALRGEGRRAAAQARKDPAEPVQVFN